MLLPCLLMVRRLDRKSVAGVEQGSVLDNDSAEEGGVFQQHFSSCRFAEPQSLPQSIWGS